MNTQNITTEQPRIYVACLAAYNNGKLHGAWIDADQDFIQDDIDKMLENSPEPDAEEWAIHDYDGFYNIKISEYQNIETIQEIAKLLEEHGEAYAAFIEYVGLEYATEDDFHESYSGEWDSEIAYAENLFDETSLHEIPDHLQRYIDYEQFSHDLFIDDMYSVQGSGRSVFVFRRI